MSSPNHPPFDSQPSEPVPQAEEGAPVGSGLTVDPTSISASGPVNNAPIKTPPTENPPWDAWDLSLLFALAVGTVLASQLWLILAVQHFRYPHQTWSEVAQKVTQTPILLILLQILIYVPIAVFMFLIVEGKYHVPFWKAIRWNWPRSQWKFLALGAVTMVGLQLLQTRLPMPKDTPFQHLFDSPLDAYLLSILAVSVGPLIEEVFFRGLLYPVLARPMGAVWAVLLTALPFGILHLQQYGWSWSAGLIVFLVGVVCGALRAVTRSVGASFLVHVGYNGTQMLLVLIATHGFRHMDVTGLIFTR